MGLVAGVRVAHLLGDHLAADEQQRQHAVLRGVLPADERDELGLRLRLGEPVLLRTVAG